jgi:hypothetical protein
MTKQPLIATLLLLNFSPAPAAEIFVSAGGNDANPGTKQKPLASFQAAQQAVRKARSSRPGESVTVTFRAGTYFLDRPLQFTSEDSGVSATQPVRYRAQPGEPVVISGGKAIKGWQPDPNRPGVLKMRAPAVAVGTNGSWRFEQLWVDGRRGVRARTPDYWAFARLQGFKEEQGDGGRYKHTFSVRPEDIEKLKGLEGEALHDVQIIVYHKWDTTREWLGSADPEAGTLVTYGSKMQDWNAMERDCLFYLENSLAALDAPGEWFLDRDGWVYYKPRPGEDLARAEVVAPLTENFLSIQGAADDPKQWVQHVRFDGLKFRYAELHVPQAGFPPGQAAMNIASTAIQLDGAADVVFTNCAVEHVGGTGIWFRHACRDCRVEHSRLSDVGIEGVRIGEMNIVPEPVRTAGIAIDNCIIQSGGRLLPHAVGVWIGQNADNTISHCDIGDFFYTAVSVGWRWGYDESAAKRNKVEFNHLHHLGYRVLSDMGGVYTLGPSEGTTVRNNVIHDVYAARYGGWGLYPDEGSTGILYENNLVYNVRDGCVHQHYGKENVFRNNVFAFSDEGQIALTRAEPHLSFTFERNLVYFDRGQLLGYAGWQNGAKVVVRSNLYWRADGKPFDFAGKSWDEWKGRDPGSMIADPRFVNPERRDFRLQPGSPVLQVGFQAIDFSQAGVQGDGAWKKLAVSVECPEPYVLK